MTGRTFAIGDIHGETGQLFNLMPTLPTLTEADTVVFLGDYVDRGPHSKEVIAFVRDLPRQIKAKVVALRGNHEDAWLKVVDEGWDEFVLPPPNGCLTTMRSFTGGKAPREDERPGRAEGGA